MKKIVILFVTTILATSCVAKKEFVELQAKHEKAQTELVDTKANLQKCLIEKERDDSKMFALTEQVKYLQEDKKTALKQVENLTFYTFHQTDVWSHDIKKSKIRIL